MEGNYFRNWGIEKEDHGKLQRKRKFLTEVKMNKKQKVSIHTNVRCNIDTVELCKEMET